MNMHFILRLGEVSLKGKNRSRFSDQLVENVKQFFDCKVRKAGGRLYVEAEEPLNFRRVFGVVNYSPAVKTSLDYDAIEEQVLKEAEDHSGSFAINTNRVSKDFEMDSMELNEELGASVVEEHGLEVDLDNPDLEIGVEIAHHAAYVFTEQVECFGGLPVGVEGTAAALIEERKDFLAALLAMKRGCEIIPVTREDTSLLRCFGCRNERVDSYDEVDAPALVVGDTLKEFKEYDFNGAVLRPLVGFEEEEVQERLEEYASTC